VWGEESEGAMTQQQINHQIEVEAKAAVRIAQVKGDKTFMEGVYRSMHDTKPPTPWKDLKRK
jgi:predicted component of type VI protein secretion system